MPILLINISISLESSGRLEVRLFGFTVGHKNFISPQILTIWEIRMPQIKRANGFGKFPYVSTCCVTILY